MSAEERLTGIPAREPAHHAEAHSYFVGRRESETAEVYAGGAHGSTPARRSTNRHYLAVVAAEIRRLGHQLRSPAAPLPPSPQD